MERKYYWLKLKKDFFKRHDIQIIESMPHGIEISHFYLKLMLESIDHDGELRFSEEIPYSNEMLASITHISLDIVDSAMKVLSDLRLIRIDEDGTIIIEKVTSMVGFETEWAKKKRAFREKKGQNEDNVLSMSSECPQNVLSMSSEERTMSDKSKSKRKSKSIDIKRNTKEKNVSLSDVLEEQVPNEKLKKAFLDFIEMRKLIKRPLTPQALKLAIGKVSELSGGDVKKAVQIIDQSVLNNWQGLYPLKTESVGRSTQTSNPYSIDWNQFTGGQAQ